MTGQVAPSRRPRSTLTILVGVVVVIAVLGAVVALQVARGGEDSTGLKGAPGGLGAPSLQDRPAAGADFPLPPTTLAAFGDGDPVNVEGYRGRPLVINFWATWCAPCVEEMPAFQQVAAETRDDVAFLGVDVMDAATNAEPFVERLGITYDLAVDLHGEYWREVRSFGMPTTLFVRPDGTVVYRHTGPLSSEELRTMLSEHLGVAA